MLLKRNIIFFLLFLLNFGFQAYGQNFQSDDSRFGYKLFIKYPTNIVHKYKMTETTKVIRTYSDSAKKEYIREVTWYFSQLARSSPKEGFIEIEISIDSLNYKFTDADKKVVFNSQGDDFSAMAFPDFKYCQVPLGKSFNMIYSPYGEVAKIEGERLDELSSYIETKGQTILDSIEKFIWLDGISFENLTYLSDIKKVMFPPGLIKVDSSWKSPFETKIDGIYLYDTADVKFVDYNNGNFTVKANSKNLKISKKQAVIYGVKNFVKVDQCKGSGSYLISISPKGTIQNAESEFNIDFKISNLNDFILEKIKTNVVWELTGQYKN